MTELEVLLMIRRYRILFLLIFVGTFIIGGYAMIPKVLRYEGSTTFYLANESMVNPKAFTREGQEDVIQVTLVQERVYQLAYSTEMMNFLIRQFDLYKHYKIDTTSADYYAKTVRRITENITFNKITPDLSSIVVYDRNNEIAATMANAVVWKLDELNKKYLIDKIQANLNFYNSFLNEATTISKEQNEKLFLYMDAFGKMRHKEMNGGGQVKQPLSEIEFSLYEAASKIEEMTTQLILAKSLYTSALSSQKTKNLPSLVVIKKALPEVKSRKKYLILFAGLAGLLACVVAIVLMYIYMSYKTEFAIIFGWKDPVLPSNNT